MRKILIGLMMILALSCGLACAEVCFRTGEFIYTGLRGREVNVIFDRTRASAEGTLYVVDEQNQVLGQRKVNAGEEIGTITITVPQDAPAMQTLSLVLARGGGVELQGTFLLAADSREDDGVRQGPTDQMKIAITFDAAYTPGRLAALLDVLDKYQAKCTFFLQGDFVKGYPNWTAEIMRRGHEVGNHTMHHPDDMREIGNEKIYWEILQCNEAIEAVTGQPVTLYRPPSGHYSYRDRAIGRGLGCEMILWTFDSMDGFLDTSTRETVWNALIQKSEPGAIILMHIYGYYTPEILDQYLPLMQAQGYEFVTVSDLLGLIAGAEEPAE
ncbi:MAG: polysaccharide deacetylase family protein [Clostridiales bacterium]|nr:polysaccharide deacetylase family protein [Clostridiales bacterium]